jgi:CO dehydrogenase nickel-insertion accessory protein CooC1
MQIRKAQRKKARIKMAIQGPSGSGKSYSSLLLAQGLSGDLSKVCVIDTENNSADLYAHLGECIARSPLCHLFR